MLPPSWDELTIGIEHSTTRDIFQSLVCYGSERSRQARRVQPPASISINKISVYDIQQDRL